MDEFINKLEEIKGTKANPFNVPEGYFDSLPSRIQERISDNQREKSIFSRFFVVAKPQLAFAFAFIVFVFISITIVKYVFDNQPKMPISNGVYTRIIEVDASEYSEQHFIEVLLDENKKPNEKKKSSEHYINYLIDEDIDYTTLIDEL
jgi:hypothetical protein